MNYYFSNKLVVDEFRQEVEDILNITQMGPIVIHLLRRNGWYEERNHDNSAWLQALSHDGYESFDYLYSSAPIKESIA